MLTWNYFKIIRQALILFVECRFRFVCYLYCLCQSCGVLHFLFYVKVYVCVGEGVMIKILANHDGVKQESNDFKSIFFFFAIYIHVLIYLLFVDNSSSRLKYIQIFTANTNWILFFCRKSSRDQVFFVFASYPISFSPFPLHLRSILSNFAHSSMNCLTE